MNVKKKVILNLEKCYSIAPLNYHRKACFLVAAEKHDRCILFDLEGNELETVWEEPGGVMSMVQVPGSDGQFLATHKFYSPNDSKEAKIIIAAPTENGAWEIRTLVELPHVHRFDIVERNGVHYLIACALKSGHEYKDDWSMPGKVYGAVLPEDLSQFDQEHQLELKVLKDNMLKNHGYYRIHEDGFDTSLISADCGVFQFYPPEAPDKEWKIETLIESPASDAVLVDFDQDGEKELAVLSPFHGDQISIYKKKDGIFKKIYDYEVKTEFTHAIYGGELAGKNALLVGHRKGERDLLVFTYDEEKQTYQAECIDHDCGPANVFHYVYHHKDMVVSTNREINEIALYEIDEL